MSETANYQRHILFESDFFEVVDITWTSSGANTTPEALKTHGHGWSECSVLVNEGVFENTTVLGAKTEVQVFEKGQVIHTPKGAKHSLRCLSKAGRTLHVYTPKIKDLAQQPLNFKTDKNNGLSESLKLNEPLRLDHLKILLAEVQKNSISASSPYFMNQLFSGVSPQMMLANELISQTKTTLATQEASPVFSQVESEVIKSLCSQIGWSPKASEGVVVPGGSAANFMAVHCAKQKYFPDMKAKGLQNKIFKVYVSQDAHYSFKKAAAVLGLGTDNVSAIGVDEKGRMKADLLEQAITADKNAGFTPLLISATAGTTVYGAFDPIDQLAAVSKKHDLWLHVDGAWGGPAIFTEKLKHLTQGIELADSVTFDAHKLFGAAMTSAYFLTQHKGILLSANDVSGADYLFHDNDDEIDRGKMSWQCGRGADAFSFWTIWKSLGTAGLGQFVDRLLATRKEVETFIKTEPRLTILGIPEYLNLCVRITPPADKVYAAADWAKIVREQLKTEHKAFVNFSTDKQGTFLRFILSHPELETQHMVQTIKWALEVQ
ncbi:glutamate decarboxylase [Bdellovibrio sp. qaytius]|nr:glutamate decarboxylase [Bdellovibrio sp. qaytius]